MYFISLQAMKMFYGFSLVLWFSTLVLTWFESCVRFRSFLFIQLSNVFPQNRVTIRSNTALSAVIHHIWERIINIIIFESVTDQNSTHCCTAQHSDCKNHYACHGGVSIITFIVFNCLQKHECTTLRIYFRHPPNQHHHSFFKKTHQME